MSRHPLIEKIRKQLQVNSEVKTDLIFPFAEGNDQILDQYEMVFKGSRKWQKEHPEQRILFTLYVGKTIFSDEPITLSNSAEFDPVGAIVFYIRKEKQ